MTAVDSEPAREDRPAPTVLAMAAPGVGCVHCGYALTGLDVAGRCPECGEPVARSVRGDRLDFADPAWLRRVARGVECLTWGVSIGIIAALIVLGGMLVSACAGIRNTDVYRVMISLGLGMPIAPTMLGICFVTAQEPRDRGRETTISRRLAARWFTLVGTSAILFGILAHVFADMAVVSPLSLAMSVIVAIALSAGLPPLYAHLGKLADRLPMHEGAALRRRRPRKKRSLGARLQSLRGQLLWLVPSMAALFWLLIVLNHLSRSVSMSGTVAALWLVFIGGCYLLLSTATSAARLLAEMASELDVTLRLAERREEKERRSV